MGAPVRLVGKASLPEEVVVSRCSAWKINSVERLFGQLFVHGAENEKTTIVIVTIGLPPAPLPPCSVSKRMRGQWSND